MFYIKALHIIFVVTWFAGLFYIVRLFIYHTEAETFEEPKKSILQTQYRLMEKRLWYGITWPSMIGTLLFGYLLLQNYFASWSWSLYAWLVLKLVLVVLLIAYHLLCGKIFKQLKSGIIAYSSMQLRIFNEVATIFLVAIVFLVELQNTLGMLWGVGGLLLFSGLLMTGIYTYKKFRKD